MYKFFENLVNPFRDEATLQSPATVTEFVLKHVYGLKKLMLLVAFFSMCMAMTEVYIFKLLGELVDSLRTSPDFFEKNFHVLIEAAALLLIGLPLAVSAHTLLWHQSLEGNFPLKIMSAGHRFFLKQSIQFYQSEAPGKVANTLLQTSNSAKLVVVKLIDTFMFAFVFSVSTVLLLEGLDVLLLIPILAWFIGYIFVILYFVPKLKFWSNKQAGSRSEMIGQVVDTYTNIATVKLFSHSSVEKSYAKKYMGNYLDTIYGQMRFISSVQFLMWGLNISLIFSTLLLSVYLWGIGVITVGAIATAVGVSFRIYTMSHWIMWEISGFFSNLGVVQDGLKLLSSPLPLTSTNTGTHKIERYDIDFDSVSFSYGENRKVVSSFSLHIEQGEKIGIVGKSGSGKSTLAKLLLRFHDPSEGAVFIGGINIRDVDHEHLLGKISVVAQDVELLDRSIRENLTYGKQNVCEDEMVRAAKAAGAHDFIMDLIDAEGMKAYDAKIGVRGSKLSGGQRQRISLARSLIKDAPIIVFDEATSALDSEIELHVMESIQPYLEGKTVVFISHRLTTLAGMDRLVVIGDGKLVELGTHKELKANKGIYSRMLDLQSEKIVEPSNSKQYDRV